MLLEALRRWASPLAGWRAPESEFCANATYGHRLDDPTNFNWCSVSGGGPDAFLFASLAVLVACCLHFSSLSAVFVLVAGALAEGLVFPFNLGRLGNAFTLWLGIDPPDIFFYAFLPPLLLDSALSIDYFLFNKVMLQVMVFAFLVVLLSTFLATPVLLYGLGLAAHGWRWQHGALFSAMLASTDALAITAVLRRAGGPESLITLMEGESLLNDASGIVLFQLFLQLTQQLPDSDGGGSEDGPSPLSVLPVMASQIAQLAAGGVLVGLTAGMLTRRLLRALRWHGASASQEVAAIQAMGYLVFYLANSPLQVSGVIAVVVFGLYGNSTSHFELASSRHMRKLEAVQSTVSFALNGIVFFFAGASATNFMIREVETLSDYTQSFALFPPVYLSMFLIRGLSILLFNPLFHLLGSQALPLRAVLFATWGGLRGAISLIMAQVIVTDESLTGRSQLVSAQMGLWTSLFVLSTLLINAPTVPAVLRFTGLAQVSPVKLSIREKAKRALLRYTAAAIQDLKADEDEMLRGVDWGTVARYVDLSEELQQFDCTDGGIAGAANGAVDDGRAGTLHEQQPGSLVPAAGVVAAAEQRELEVEALGQQEKIFDSAGWAAPSSIRGSARRRREAALADLGKTSSQSPLNSSRRLLGASFANLSHKWEPRSVVPPLAGPPGASSSEDEGSGSDLEAPLLPPSPRIGHGMGLATATAAARGDAGRVRTAHSRRGSLLRRSVSAASGGGSDLGLGLAVVAGGVDRGRSRGISAGLSRSCSIDKLTKYGSAEFSDESPFFSASSAGGGGSKREPLHLMSANSAPQMHTIVEVGSSEEEGEGDEPEDWEAVAVDASLQQQQQQCVQSKDSDSCMHRYPQPPPQQHRPQARQHFAPLDFDVLPSFPSDAVFSLADSVTATPPPHASGAGAAGGSGGDGGRGADPSDSSFASPPGSASGPDLRAQPQATSACDRGDSHGQPAGVAMASTPPAAVPPLPPLRLARTLLHPTGTTTGAMSPRGGPPRPATLAALAAEASSAPQSPRSMHGLVRTSLLPAAADRQAVQHVGELLSEDFSPQEAVGSGAGSSASAGPLAAPSSGPLVAAATPIGPPQLGRLSAGWPSLLRPSAGSTASTGGGSGGGSGDLRMGGHRRFGGLLHPESSAGLAALLRPPSPGKISPLTSTATSPEPTDSPRLEQGQGEEVAGEGQEQPEAEQPPLSLLDRAACQLGGSISHLAVDTGASETLPPEAAEEVIDTGFKLEKDPEFEPSPASGLPGLPLPMPRRARSIAGYELGRRCSLALPAAPHHLHHAASAVAMPPSLGADVAVAARFAAVPGIKPWQASTVLLRRSLSTPLTGIAEQLEQQHRQQQRARSTGSEASQAASDNVGSSGGAGGGGSGGGQWSEEVLAEARMRLVAGLKRYFHSKRGEGLLSAQGLRILDYACDRAVDQAHAPLDIWSVAEGEVVGKYVVRALAWLFFRTKRLTSRLPRLLRFLLMPPLRWFSGLIGSVLSVTMLVACEVAVEYWMALTWSPQAQWLRESDKAGQLQAEIAEESTRVCKFIIDREIEAPERFQAIQSYRAAMAILRQQAAFVDELYASGIVNDVERQAMQEPVQRRGRQLEIRGPVWRAPSVREVLRGLPFLHHVPELIFDWLLDRGLLLEYTRGEVIQAPASHLGGPHVHGGEAQDLGLCIVVYGLVRSSFKDERGVSHEYFLGSGGVLGLLGALVGQRMRGSGAALAEGNALHKGPLIFYLPQSVIRRIRQRAVAGDHTFAQLELDLFRVAGLYIVERLKGEVAASVAAHYQALAVERARRRAIRKAAAAVAAAANSTGEGRGLRQHRHQPQQQQQQPEEQQGLQGGGAAVPGAAGAAGEAGKLRQRVHWDSSLGEEQAMQVEEAAPQLHRSGGLAGGTAAPSASSFVPLTGAEVLAGMDRHKLWYNAQAFARGILAHLRRHLRDAELLRLAPKQPWRQRTHALLMHGSLHSSSSCGASSGGPHTDMASPTVLPWLLGHVQGGHASAGEGGMLPGSLWAAALGASARLVAGPSGALLLVCPVERGSPLTPSSNAGSAGDFGSPLSDAGGGWQDMAQHERQQGQQQAGLEQEEAAQQRQPGEEHLEPAGRPLHRVKSRRQAAACLPASEPVHGITAGKSLTRLASPAVSYIHRLPMSTALLGMESVVGP